MGKGLAFSMKEAVISRVSKATNSREHDPKGLVGFRNVNYSNDLRSPRASSLDTTYEHDHELAFDGVRITRQRAAVKTI